MPIEIRTTHPGLENLMNLGKDTIITVNTKKQCP